MKIHHDLHPELNHGPADLQSAALTIELCTLGFGIQSNNHDHHLYMSNDCPATNSQPVLPEASHHPHQKGSNREEHSEYISVARVQPRTHKTE